MTTSPANIRVLHPGYSADATARQLDDEHYQAPSVDPGVGGTPVEDEAHNRRQQLKVISGQLKRAPIGYTIFVMSIPVIALLIVLVVNIVVSNRQYELVELKSQMTTITQTNEALAQQVSQKSAPQSVAQQAADMGMVMPGTPASIDLATGTVMGTAVAAEAGNKPTSFVAEPTVRSSTGIPTAVEVPTGPDGEPVVVSQEDVPGPASNTVKVMGPQVSVPTLGEAESSAEDGVAHTVETSSVGSLQGPQVRLPADN